MDNIIKLKHFKNIVFFVICAIVVIVVIFKLKFFVSYLSSREKSSDGHQLNANIEIRQNIPDDYLVYKNDDFGFSFLYPEKAVVVENKKNHDLENFYEIVAVRMSEKGFGFKVTYIPKDPSVDFKTWYALNYQEEIDDTKIEPIQILDFKNSSGYLFEEFNFDHVSENAYVVKDNYILIFGGYAVPPSFFEEVDNEYPVFKKIMNSQISC